MIMKILGFDMEVDISNENTNLLVVTDNKLFGSICCNLNDKNSDNIVFVSNDSLINMKDILIVFDLLNFNINNKTIINKLYNHLSDNIISNIDEENELKDNFMKMVRIVYDEIDDFNVDISLNEELDLIKLFKMLNVEINTDYDGVLERMIDLLEIYSELNDQTIIFINILSYFSDEEIIEIQKYINYKKLSVLFFENSYNRGVYFENQYIIDDDFYDYAIQFDKK
ncbi:type II-A CRISPR-associated protein Csn2 [Faecalibacillus faecis]|uniref:type II-A CRISPR-associated protein Csn2 n=2 Tax=Faecalibacillus faecis TaxID=1982628 RepID=UPI000E4C981B|nr:type II-A CRISPR-associated protein Csn2 [Faecalibacillus faecis]RHP21554.1 type II-A CRISPR-associated protein Csn2 [Coprobacillus sp. AF34-1BH]